MAKENIKKEKTINDLFKIVEKNSSSMESLVKTVDHLAAITKKGFDNTVDKDDFNDLRSHMYEFKDEMYDLKDDMTSFKNATKIALYSMDSKIESIDKRLDAIDKTLGPLVQISSAMQTEIRSLNLRVGKLEHKAGLVK